MKRAVARPTKFRAIGIYSLIAVVVVFGIALVYFYRASVTPPAASPPGTSMPPTATPGASTPPTATPPSSSLPASPPPTSTPGASTPPVSNPTVKRGTYQQVPNQVLFAVDSSGKPNISGDLTNIVQGDAGDCYFLAALMTVAAREPETIVNMVHDNGDGTYTISFHSRYDGVANPVTVTVNGDLPYRRGKPFENGIENIDGKNVSWAAIIEKGWAAANGNNYKNINGTDLSNLQDHDVHNALYAITGKEGVDRNPGGPMTEVSFDQMQQDFSNGLVTLGTSELQGQAGSRPFLRIAGCQCGNQTVVVGNPEGGQSTLTFDTFQSTNINQYIALPTYP